MRHLTIQIKLALVLCLFITGMSRADIRLPAMVGDHMVLQQNTSVNIWGWADSGETVNVVASWGQTVSTRADKSGQWKAQLPTPGGSHTPHQIILQGNNTLYLRNVLVGEVWLCSGQSNMGWSVKQSNNSYMEIQQADYPSIRFFHVPNTMKWEPQEDVNARWEQCRPETVADKSAVAYYFGKVLTQKLDVPVGLIISAWGGSGAQAWIDKTSAQKEVPEIAEWYDKHEATMKQRHFEWMKGVAEWRSTQQSEQLDWSSRPARRLPADQHIPFALYNGMIHPLKNYTLKGALWYQGESNVPRANQYRRLFPAMIRSWRNAWQQGEFPFYFVQLAPYHYNDHQGVTSAELRDAQQQTLREVANTGMVVTTDIGNANDIHPRKKQEVGQRLAMLALHHDYGQLDQGYASPVYSKSEVKQKHVVVSFDYAKSLKVRRGNRIEGLQIAGKDQRFVPAQGEIINGNQLKVWSPSVKRPVAVRFGWSNAPFLNLFNEANLPVSPFKTDSWKDTTEGEIHLSLP